MGKTGMNPALLELGSCTILWWVEQRGSSAKAGEDLHWTPLQGGGHPPTGVSAGRVRAAGRGCSGGPLLGLAVHNMLPCPIRDFATSSNSTVGIQGSKSFPSLSLLQLDLRDLGVEM